MEQYSSDLLDVNSSSHTEKLINLCIEHFDYDDAIILAEAYYSRVKSEKALYILAQCHAQCRQYEVAYDLLKRNNFQSPQCRYLYAKVAYNLNRLQDSESALKDETVNDQILLHPSFKGTTTLSFAHSLLAKILCESCRADPAKLHWKTSIKACPVLWSSMKNYCDIGGQNIKDICFKAYNNKNETCDGTTDLKIRTNRREKRSKTGSIERKSTSVKKRSTLLALKKDVRTRTRPNVHPLSSVNFPNIVLPIEHQTTGEIDFDDTEPMDSENTPSQAENIIQHPPSASKVIKNNQNLPSNTVFNDLSEWLIRLGCVQECLSHFRCSEAYALLNDVPMSFSELSLTLELKARIFFENGEYKRACGVFEIIRRLYPKRVQGMEIYSTALWQLQDSYKLSTLSSDMMNIARDQPQTWCIVGNCFSLEKQRELAVECLERAIRLDPKFGYAYSLLGHELIEMNDLTRAANAFRQAVPYSPNDYRVLYGLGLVYYKEEQLQLARTNLIRAVKIHPTNTVLLCQLAVIEQALHLMEPAMKYLERALKHSPNNVPCRYHKARLLFDMGRYEEALIELKELRLLAPDEAHVFFLLGRVHKKLNGDKNNKALINFNFATEIDPRGDQNHSRISEGPYDDDPI